MKKILFSCLALVTIARAEAQQKEGKVIYQRTIQMQFVTTSDASGEENTIPRTRTDKFEMNFANGQMIWKQMEDEIQDDNFEWRRRYDDPHYGWWR